MPLGACPSLGEAEVETNSTSFLVPNSGLCYALARFWSQLGVLGTDPCPQGAQVKKKRKQVTYDQRRRQLTAWSWPG